MRNWTDAESSPPSSHLLSRVTSGKKTLSSTGKEEEALPGRGEALKPGNEPLCLMNRGR